MVASLWSVKFFLIDIRRTEQKLNHMDGSDSYSVSAYRSVWIRMDKSWSAAGPLDCPNDFHSGHRHCQRESVCLFEDITDLSKYSIYQSSIDYTVAAYGAYAASATAGNDFARDFLAGIAAMYSTPMFENIGDTHSYEYASTILACVSILVTVPIYYFYRHGPAIRERSPFAKEMMELTKKRQSSHIAGDEKQIGQDHQVENVCESSV